MAKKKIGLRNTLKKSQENLEDLSLPERKPLPKIQKDLQDMKETVEILHQKERGGEEPIASQLEESKQLNESISTPVSEIQPPKEEKTPPPSTRATKTSEKPKKALKQPEIVKLKRLTIDMEKPLHKQVKLRCDENEISMREYIIGLIEKDIRKRK